MFYQNEQQTISILRSETNSLYKILEQEKENHKNELENEIKNGGISKQLIEERIDSLKIELNHQKKQTEGLKNLMESVKKSHSKELKKMRLDLNNINKFITDKQNRFNEEKKKLTQEIQKHENNLYQKEQNYKKIYENKLIKFAENIEEKNKMINSSKN